MGKITIKDRIALAAQESRLKALVKPCPFCGSDDLRISYSYSYGVKTPNPEAYKLNIRCNRCEADVTFAPDIYTMWADGLIVDCGPEFDPFDHWNARAQEKQADGKNESQ